VVTAKGNHARRYSNLRELESFLAVEDASGASRGFIAPYNAQISLSERVLPADFVNLTVHKFQGRECEEIVFSTVIDKKADARALDFVDDPHLINVAVSRAQKQFTLLTGDGVFSGNNKHVAALVRYMTYYASTTQVHHIRLSAPSIFSMRSTTAVSKACAPGSIPQTPATARSKSPCA